MSKKKSISTQSISSEGWEGIPPHLRSNRIFFIYTEAVTVLIERWGRGTQKILNLCVKAGHPEPDFFEQSNSFVVRFLPSGYIAPHRISHNLTDRQREILQAVSSGIRQGVTLADVRLKLSAPPADRTLRDDFQHLKRLGLVDLMGRGRGARWVLVNKAEFRKLFGGLIKNFKVFG